jgi:hypothetical protein
MGWRDFLRANDKPPGAGVSRLHHKGYDLVTN